MIPMTPVHTNGNSDINGTNSTNDINSIKWERPSRVVVRGVVVVSRVIIRVRVRVRVKAQG